MKGKSKGRAFVLSLVNWLFLGQNADAAERKQECAEQQSRIRTTCQVFSNWLVFLLQFIQAHGPLVPSWRYLSMSCPQVAM